MPCFIVRWDVLSWDLMGSWGHRIGGLNHCIILRLDGCIGSTAADVSLRFGGSLFKAEASPVELYLLMIFFNDADWYIWDYDVLEPNKEVQFRYHKLEFPVLSLSVIVWGMWCPCSQVSTYGRALYPPFSPHKGGGEHWATAGQWRVDSMMAKVRVVDRFEVCSWWRGLTRQQPMTYSACHLGGFLDHCGWQRGPGSEEGLGLAGSAQLSVGRLGVVGTLGDGAELPAGRLEGLCVLADWDWGLIGIVLACGGWAMGGWVELGAGACVVARAGSARVEVLPVGPDFPHCLVLSPWWIARLVLDSYQVSTT